MKEQLMAAALALGLVAAATPVAVQANPALQGGRIKHVLLISIDGLHALDVANYMKSHPGSALDELSEHGVTFSNARTPANSDSFPGLLALVTGGSPRTHGLFYDYSYDRTIWAPDNKTCSGQPGTQMIFDESIDVYVNGVSQNVIDPNALPRYIDAPRTLFSVLSAQCDPHQHRVRSNQGRARGSHRLGGQAPCLRFGEWPVGQGCGRFVHAGDHERRRLRQHV